QTLGEHHVTGERVENVLPRPYSGRAANDHRLAVEESAHEVGYDPHVRPVTSADDVTGARAGDADTVLVKFVGRKEGRSVARRDELRARLAVRVRILSAQLVYLAISPRPLAIVVALVAGDHDHAAHARGLSHG